MKSEDVRTIRRMIAYCDDVAYLLDEYDGSFDRYKTQIAFQYVCNMCIIQIGELVGRLSDDFLEQHRDIPWHAIKAMRNLHAHDYERVDLAIVWKTLTEEIPDLKARLEKMV